MGANRPLGHEGAGRGTVLVPAADKASRSRMSVALIMLGPQAFAEVLPREDCEEDGCRPVRYPPPLNALLMLDADDCIRRSWCCL